MAKKLKWQNSDEVVVKYAINDAHGNTIDVNSKVDKTTTVNGHALSSNVTITKSDVGLGSVNNTSDATKKTNFTGSIASGNTGFVTGGDVYSALNLKADKTELPHLYKHTVVDNNNVEYIIIDNDNNEITTSTLLSHMLNAVKKMMSDPQNSSLPCCFDVICVFESTSKVVIYNGTTGVKILTIAPTSLTDTITDY